MTKRRTQRNQRLAITAIEVVITIVVCGGLLMLLLPALNSSREAARENLCRKNLRRMFLAAQMPSVMNAPTAKAFGTTQTGLDSWPIAILKGLKEEVDRDGPRPGTLTCPSRPADNDLPPSQQVSQYAATIFLDRSNVKSRWMFAERELEIPAYDQYQWADADTIELPIRLPNKPPELRKGPHADGSYLYTARDGSVQSVTPQPAERRTKVAQEPLQDAS